MPVQPENKNAPVSVPEYEKTGVATFSDKHSELFWLWRNRHEQSVRIQNLKIVMHTIEYRLRASPRHGGQVFFELYVTETPRGRPFGGGGKHHKWRSV
jgi:hypothetical protein